MDISTDFLLKALAVFVVAGILDVIWTLYIQSVALEKKHLASSMSSVIIMFTAYVTIAYVHDIRLTVVAAAGGYIGTYLTMLYKEKKGLTME